MVLGGRREALSVNMEYERIKLVFGMVNLFCEVGGVSCKMSILLHGAKSSNQILSQ